MKDQPSEHLERCRVRTGPLRSDPTYGNNGAFCILIGGLQVKVIISDEGGWDHVSASAEKRCLTW